MSKKCPICNEGKYSLTFSTDGYTEPPEHLYECNTCGFSEYSMYPMESPIFFMKSSIQKTEKSYLDSICEVEKYSLPNYNEADYKKFLLKYLKENKLTINDLISNRKSHFDYIEKQKSIHIENRRKEKERLEKGLLTDTEQEERRKFESDIKNANELFIDLGIVTRVDGSLVMDSERSSEYASKKFQEQKKYCKENGIPMFSSSKCFKCGQSIYGQKIVKITFLGKEYEKVVENTSLLKASNSVITGCPCCSKSFVD